MKISLALIIAALFVVVTQAADDFDEQVRELHGRGRRHGGRGGFSFSDGSFSSTGSSALQASARPLDCSAAKVTCTPKGHRREVVELNSGVRVCLQDPYNETNFVDVCMDADESGNTTAFSDNNKCGCCGDVCPEVCDTCSCNGFDRYGEEFEGVYMNTTSSRHHRRLRRGSYSGSRSGNRNGITCVPTLESIDKQLSNGVCLEESVCPAPCSSCPCDGMNKYGEPFEGFYMKDSRGDYTTCVPKNVTTEARLDGGICFDDVEGEESEKCPTPCGTCPCTAGTAEDGTEMGGFYMNITRYSRRSYRKWYRKSYTSTICIRTDETVERQTSDGVCLAQGETCPE